MAELLDTGLLRLLQPARFGGGEAHPLNDGKVVASLPQGAFRSVRIATDCLLDNVPEFDFHADLGVAWAAGGQSDAYDKPP